MKKKFYNFMFFAALLTSVLFSCKVETETNSSEKVTVKFSIDERSSSISTRTAEPGIAILKFNSFILTGSKDGEEAKELGNWNSVSDLTDTTMELELGNWSFTLVAKTPEEIEYSSTVTKTLVYGVNNINFSLEQNTLGNGNGDIFVEISFPSNKVKTVTISVYDYPEMTKVCEEDITTIAEDSLNALEFITYTKTELPVGQYRVVAELFADNEKAFSLGKYKEIFTVAAGLLTSDSFTIDKLSDVYSINYVLNGGTIIGNAPEVYSSKKSVTLPIIMRDGFIFGGWFLEEDFSGNAVTEISSENSKGDVTVYSKWNESPKINAAVSINSFNDIALKKSDNGSKIIFWASEGYDSYEWECADLLTDETSNIFEFDLTDKEPDVYNIYVIAKKGNKYYSATASIKILDLNNEDAKVYATDEGIKFDLSLPDSTAMIRIMRYEEDLDEYALVLKVKGITEEYISVTDYFVDAEKNYKYEIGYYSSDKNSDFINAKFVEVLATNGKGEITLKNSPTYTYSEETGILTFSEMPEMNALEFDESFDNVYYYKINVQEKNSSLKNDVTIEENATADLSTAGFLTNQSVIVKRFMIGGINKNENEKIIEYSRYLATNFTEELTVPEAKRVDTVYYTIALCDEGIYYKVNLAKIKEDFPDIYRIKFHIYPDTGETNSYRLYQPFDIRNIQNDTNSTQTFEFTEKFVDVGRKVRVCPTAYDSVANEVFKKTYYFTPKAGKGIPSFDKKLEYLYYNPISMSYFSLAEKPEEIIIPYEATYPTFEVKVDGISTIFDQISWGKFCNAFENGIYKIETQKYFDTNSCQNLVSHWLSRKYNEFGKKLNLTRCSFYKRYKFNGMEFQYSFEERENVSCSGLPRSIVINDVWSNKTYSIIGMENSTATFGELGSGKPDVTLNINGNVYTGTYNLLTGRIYSLSGTNYYGTCYTTLLSDNRIVIGNLSDFERVDSNPVSSLCNSQWKKTQTQGTYNSDGSYTETVIEDLLTINADGTKAILNDEEFACQIEYNTFTLTNEITSKTYQIWLNADGSWNLIEPIMFTESETGNTEVTTE